MKILQILPQLDVGGVETGTVDLARYLKRHGCASAVASAGGSLVPQLEAEGIPHYKLPVASKAFWVMWGASRRLRAIIVAEKIDIVHARSRVPAWVAFMATRGTDVTFVTTAHGRYSRHPFSPMMGWGKFTIVPSAVIGRYMMAQFKVPRENIRFIPRSVDLERYRFRGMPAEKKKKEPLFGVVGRLSPVKGHVYFLKALALVRRTLPDARAWIVGGASPGKQGYQEDLGVWCRRLGLEAAVTFCGSRKDVPDVLCRLDCLVMPSVVEESFGRVLIEAQAVGVPVVASRIGGINEVVADGEDGLLVDPRDHEGLAKAMLQVLQDAPLAERLIANGRRKAEDRYSLERMGAATLAVYEEALTRPRLLVIKMGALGDTVLVVPSLKAIRKKFPSAHVTCLVGREAETLLRRCPFVDDLIVCDLRSKHRGLRGLLRLGRLLLRLRFDSVIDFQNNKKSHLLGYLSFAAKRYGYDNGKWGFFLNRKAVDSRAPMDPVRHQFQVLRMLGIDYHGEELELWPSAEDRAHARRFLEEAGWKGQPLVGLNIGASPRWHTKRWPVEHFAEICGRLDERGYAVVLTGSRADAGRAQQILKKTAARPLCAVARTSFLELAALMESMSVFVTGDSAPMHAAAAMKTPFVALFGPTDPRRHVPAGTRHIVLQKGCRPCYKDTCPKRHTICMKTIKPADVLAAVVDLMPLQKEIKEPDPSVPRSAGGRGGSAHPSPFGGRDGSSEDGWVECHGQGPPTAE